MSEQTSEKSSGSAIRRPTIGEIIEQGKLGLRLLRDSRVPKWQKLIPGLAIAYLLSPIDLLAEIAVGPLGYVDDITLLAVALRIFIQIAPKDVVADLRGDGGDAEPISTSYRVHED